MRWMWSLLASDNIVLRYHCAILAQRLFVEKAGLPSPRLNEIKRLVAWAEHTRARPSSASSGSRGAGQWGAGGPGADGGV